MTRSRRDRNFRQEGRPRDGYAASIRKETHIACSPEKAWDALRDVGALHNRLVPGFVVDTKLEDGARIVTFGNGMVARELIVDVDDAARRVAWSVVGAPYSSAYATSRSCPSRDDAPPGTRASIHSRTLIRSSATPAGVRMRERVLIFQRFKLACLGFGATFSALFWIPCGCQIVLLPVAAAAATGLVWELLAGDPALLPELERPARKLGSRETNALGSGSD